MLLAALGDKRASDWVVRLSAAGARPTMADGPRTDPEVRLGASGVRTSIFEEDGLVVVAQGLVQGAGLHEESARVLAHRFRKLGQKGLKGLGGAYAFILFDAGTRSFLAAADATARAPLSYARKGGRWLVSSRALALACHPDISTEFDEEYVLSILAGLWYPPQDATAWREVRRLVPGAAIAGAAGAYRVVEGFDPLVERGPSEPARDHAHLRRSLGEVMAEHAPAGSCLALSGGLDSGALAAVLARSQPVIESITVRARGAPDEEDRERLGLLCSQFPGIRSATIDAPEGDPYASAGSELPDDPVIVPLGFVASWRAIYARAAQMRCSVVFDGDGGDELFALLPSAIDLSFPRDWGLAWSAARKRDGVRMTAWRGLALPALPSFARRALLRRELQQSAPPPAWLLADLVGSAAFRRAADRCLEESVLRPFPRAVREWLAHPGVLGSMAGRRALARGCGVEVVSPFLDRRVVELLLSLPARTRVGAEPGKEFLRQAANDLPEAVRQQKKDAAMHEWLDLRLLASAESRAVLRDRAVAERLGSAIDVDRFAQRLVGVAGGYRPDRLTRSRLLDVLAFAFWFRALTHRKSVGAIEAAAGVVS
jgi:asparagine synthase (glutamine-hydrolysing)